MTIYSSAAFPPSQFWDFAVKLYSNGPVSEACLSLQDRRGIDVNMLLFCVWVAASGRGRLSEAEMAVGIEAGQVWQSEVVAPLRHVRRYLKGPITPADARLGAELARVITDSELYAEHMEVQILSEIVTRPAVGSFDNQERGQEAADNLQTYMGHVVGEMDDQDQAELHVVWQEAFPDANPRLTELFFRMSPA